MRLAIFSSFGESKFSKVLCHFLILGVIVAFLTSKAPF